MPDCPIYSYRNTVSALAGTISYNLETKQENYPYLLLFTFSPVQEFIKASRKFVDFWAGSYLLHYLSAKLCWSIACRQGPDTIITPNLWGQEIIDALLMNKYRDFEQCFQGISPDGLTPVTRFNQKVSNSLVTAGFPNTITVLTAGKETAEELGKYLSDALRQEWENIAEKVRENIKQTFLGYLEKEGKDLDTLWRELREKHEFSVSRKEELARWLSQHGIWEWNKLWNAQIQHTWEPYWVAVPLGNPHSPEKLKISENASYRFDDRWIEEQEMVAQTLAATPPPTLAEKTIYKTLNVGTWWGSLQARLGQAVEAVKNTRVWQIPAAPGNRSTISGQFSALHPRLNYSTKFQEGAGISPESMSLFWRVMAEVYPGLFNGSEQLNAIEVTKRMAWAYGGVANYLLGIEKIEETVELPKLSEEVLEELDLPPKTIADIDYNQLIRFPNLSSIAAARFAHEDWLIDGGRKLSGYWRNLAKSLKKNLGERKRYSFACRTRARPFHLLKTDFQINPHGNEGRNYNGVMFSSKWLADDLGLERNDTDILRGLVEKAHQQSGFAEGSPSDWWVIVLGDGDGMGEYVSGQKLHPYKKYLIDTDPNNFITGDRYPLLNQQQYEEKKREFIQQFGETDNGKEEPPTLLETRKRMGPATHVGLNRALLDFSNRIVPYLTESRFCGRTIYSGGDDVMAVLPLEDLPEYLLSLRAAWCGGRDPYGHLDPNVEFREKGGYWQPEAKRTLQGLPNRPLFTMGEGATMSLGIVIAHKSVPLPTVLKSLWEAEAEQAKKMEGVTLIKKGEFNKKDKILKLFPDKDGLCFRVIYGSGNCLEALMKGHLLDRWWKFVNTEQPDKLSPLLYRLAEELPRHGVLTKKDRLVAKAAKAIANRREESKKVDVLLELIKWLKQWETWAFQVETAWEKRQQTNPQESRPLGISLEELAKLLRFTAFWLDKMHQRAEWHKEA